MRYARFIGISLFLSPVLASQPNSYVSPGLCSACHVQIAKAYAETGMGRGFSKPTPQTAPASQPFHHARSDTWYSMEFREGVPYQRRWRTGPDGTPIDVQESRIDYVLGSGNRARSYLHRTARGALIELPLGWYSENGGLYAMSPGYDRDYALPHRTVPYECMFCHNAYPQIPAHHDEPGAEPVYSGDIPEGIDCQRCHGPGANHIAAARAASPNLTAIRAAIVNPARLTPQRQLEVCMQCHLETTSRPLPHSIVKYNRGPFSYQPGQPLTDFQLFFDRTAAAKSPNDFEIVSSAYRLRESRCFLQSAGKLTCTTCHNPHTAQPDTAAFNAKCTACHADSFRQAIGAGRHTDAPDCVSCHMPKRRTHDVVHAVMTDHLIARRPPAGDLLAPLAEESSAAPYRGKVVPYPISSSPPAADAPLYTAVAQVSQRTNLANGLPQLAAALAAHPPTQSQFYVELGQAYAAAGKRANAVAAFEQAAQRNPSSPVVALNLADALTEADRPAAAFALLERALKTSPEEPLLWYQLGIAHSAANQAAEARAAFEKSISLDPDLTEAHNLLGAAYASSGDLDRASAEFLHALQIDPDYPDALGNLGHLLAARNQLAEAAFCLARAVQLKPADPEIRTNYAVTLAGLRRNDEALAQIDAALKTDPQSAEAHNFRGLLLQQSGQPAAALAEFLQALRLQPNFARAHLNAARTLLSTGDRLAAIPHLRAAANSPDAAVSRQAEDLLHAKQQ